MSADFDRRSTAEEVTEGVDLAGKTALVTGVSSGIGAETLRVLALRGAHVFGAARTLERARAAAAGLPGRVTPIGCELTDQDDVRRCAAELVAQVPALDLLIANAGIMALPKLEQVNGIEKQFATNHLGHFLLVNLLKPSLTAAGARVVVVSSAAHLRPPPEGIQFENLSGERGYGPLTAYAQSKLANVLFANGLGQRFHGVTANAVHPGVIRTQLARYWHPALTAVLGVLTMPFSKSIPQGAATQCWVATAAELDGVSGRYFADCREARSHALASDKNLGDRLWRVSEELTGLA